MPLVLALMNGIDHHLHRPARPSLRQRCGERQAGAAPRERRVVGSESARDCDPVAMHRKL